MATNDKYGRSRRRTSPWPTLISLPLFVVLLGLGTWQVQRLHWKQALIDDLTAQLAQAPIELKSVTGIGEQDSFRRVRVTGAFLHRHELLVVPRTHAGSAGAHVLTPFRLDGGGVVLVNRGWVPNRRLDPARRVAGQITGRVEVRGIVRADGRPSRWTPDNRPAQNVWYYVDVAAMLARAGLPESPPFVIDAGPEANPGGYPRGGQTRTVLANNHLQYAITWYALAAVLAVIYILYQRRRPDDPVE